MIYHTNTVWYKSKFFRFNLPLVFVTNERHIRKIVDAGRNGVVEKSWVASQEKEKARYLCMSVLGLWWRNTLIC